MPALVSEFDGGQYHQALNEQQIATAAATIAQFHAAQAKITLPTDADRNPEHDGAKTRNDAVGDYLKRLGAAEKNLHQASKDALDANVANKTRHLPKGLMHSDLRPENFLFSEGDTSMTLLDLERVKPNGELLFDLATFISKSVVIAELQHQIPPKHEEKIAAFLKSYHEKRPLTADEVKALPEYIQSRTFYVTALRSGLEKTKPDLYIDLDTGLNIQTSLQQYLDKTNFKDMLGVDEKTQEAERSDPMRLVNPAMGKAKGF
ncbi:MAG: phosphotransferase [Rickettsiales bacterium]|nr:phosphotransferase [Rickettsiales bacterium]